MSTLRSGLDELATEELRFVSDDDLEGLLVELERAAGVIEAERARRLTEAASRGVHARDGYLSPTPWLTRVLGVAASCAARYLRWTEALERMPRTREALANGEITSSTAGVLLAAFRDHPEAFAEGERVLLDAARNLSVRDLGRSSRIGGRWRTRMETRAARSDCGSGVVCTCRRC
ncbi:MAG: hypothetical protein ACXWXQ_03665 [Actinomycetota bacterium]